MKNLFNKKDVTRGMRMYATPDGKQRYYGSDTKYFILSYNLWMNEDYYTICGSSGKAFYSYAVLDMYGATIEAGYCNGEFIEVKKEGEAKYIMVSGFVSDLETLMILDAPKSEVGDNPKYIPYDGGSGGGGGDTENATATLLAANFIWDGETTYTINSFVNSYIDEVSDLPDSFVIYLSAVDKIVAHAKVNLFGWIFDMEHVNGNVIENDIRLVPNVLPVLFNKSSKKARILYSYDVTSQGGYGLEDAVLVLDDEPVNNG